MAETVELNNERVIQNGTPAEDATAALSSSREDSPANSDKISTDDQVFFEFHFGHLLVNDKKKPINNKKQISNFDRCINDFNRNNVNETSP